MNIGVDLDGVVFDTEIYYRAYADLYNYEHMHYKLADREEARVFKRYYWPQEVFDKFLEKYLFTIQTTAPILPLAKQVLKKLSEQGHKLIVISKRGDHFPEEIDITYKRCANENLHFDKFYFQQVDKIEVCKKEKIDVMLEDYYPNVCSLSENDISCIYFRNGLLNFCNANNVVTVDNWGQVPEALDILTKKLSKN